MVFSGLVIVVSGLFLFGVWRKHLLISLLSLEFMVLGVLFLFYGSFLNFGFLFSLVYLTFTACEGALGLSILVSMARTHGGDYFSSFHLF
uniref:NADH-ubiquinone oxidoreductase chain 4L n=1 Tax=Tullbergia mixta TaxID=1499077 RepID=A0A7T6Y6Z7_9HEXA|nr:NADH dehydrogenase subunit 4L [Tullbergia mixta]QQK54727.1 NADH dehydrogenase subunit 4L [Tullbergia mixta]